MRRSILSCIIIQMAYFPWLTGQPTSIQLVTQRGHKSPITAACMSTDNHLVVSGDQNGRLVLWDTKSQRQLKEYNSKLGPIINVDISESKNQIVASGNSGFERINLHTGSRKFSQCRDCYVLFKADSLLLTTGNRLVVDNDTLPAFPSPIQLSTDGNTVSYVEGSSRRDRIRFYDVGSKKMLNTTIKDGKRTRSYQVIDNYVVLLKGNKLEIYELSTAKLLFVRNSPFINVPLKVMAINPNKEVVAIAMNDFSVELWHFKKNKRIKRLFDHYAEIKSIRFSHNGKYLFTTSADRSIAVYDLNLNPGRFVRLKTSVGRKQAVATDVNENLFIGDEYGNVWKFNINNPYDYKTLAIHNKAISEILCDSDSTIISVGYDGVVSRYDHVHQRSIYEVKPYKHTEFWIKFCRFWYSYNPLMLVFGGELLGNPTASEITLNYSDAAITAAALNEECSSLAVGGRVGINRGKRKIILLEAQSGRINKRIKANNAQINAIDFLDQQNLVSGGGRLLPSNGTIGGLKRRGYDSRVMQSDAGNGPFKILDFEHTYAVNQIQGNGEYLFVGVVSHIKDIKRWNDDDDKLEFIDQYYYQNRDMDQLLVIDKKTYEVLDTVSIENRFLVEGDEILFVKNRQLYRASIQDGQVIDSYAFGSHEDRVSDMELSASGNHLITSSWDGSIKIWDSNDFTEMASLILMDEEEVLLTNPAHTNYLSTKGAYKHVGFNVDNHFYGLESFDLYFNNPDSILSDFGIQNAFTDRLRRARLRRYALHDFQISAIDFANIPEVTIIDQEVRGDQLIMNLKISSKDPIKSLSVAVNGVPMFKPVVDWKYANGPIVKAQLIIPLGLGTNRIEIAAVSDRNLSSLKEVSQIYYVSEEESKPKLYFVGIGVSKFALDPSQNRKYLDKDIKDFQAELEKTNIYSEIDSILLLDSAVKKESIDRVREKLSHAHVDDVIIVFYSGHGVLDDAKNYYLATHDMDFNQPEERGLKYDSLIHMIDHAAARRRLILINACLSGEIPYSDQDYLTMRKYFDDYRSNNGSHIISSSGKDQKSLTPYASDLKNSVFGYVLVDTMKKNRSLYVDEIVDKISLQVQRKTGNEQTPNQRVTNKQLIFRIR